MAEIAAVETPTLHFRVPHPVSSQLQGLLQLQNNISEYSFTDSVILCLDGFIPFHRFLISYFNHGDEPIGAHENYVGTQNQAQGSQGTATNGTASDSVINMENYCVKDVAQVVLFLYVGTISLWPTSVVSFREILIELGCNILRIQVMDPLSVMFHNYQWSSAPAETAEGRRLRFMRDNHGIITEFFVTANGSIVHSDYANIFNIM